MRMVLGMALAGGVWLAAGGMAAAQGEIVEFECPPVGESIFGFLEVPGVSNDDTCIFEVVGASQSDIRLEFHEALICAPGEEDCLGRASAEREALRARIQYARVSPSGVELVRIDCSGSIGGLSDGGTCLEFMTVEASTRTETVTRVDTSARTDVFSTRITGEVGGATVLDETRDLPFAAPEVQALVSDAGFAVTAAGGPGVVVLAPVLLERTETLVQTTIETQREVVGEPVLSFTFNPVVGPDTIEGGTTIVPGNDGSLSAILTTDLGLCATASTGNNGAPPTGCENSGAVAAVPFGVSANLVYLNTHTDVLETVTGTETWEIFEHWQVAGVVRALGAIHAAVQSGGYDLGQRLLRRMGDEGAGPRGFALPSEVTTSSMGGPGVQRFGWVEGYGTRARVDATGTTEAETRSSAGVAAGMTWVFPSGATLGFGLDHGTGDVGIAAAGESADIRLTQAALMGGIDRGDWFATGVLSFGSGEVEATTTLGGAATASYSLRTTGVQAEAGWRLRAGDWRITPSVGADYLAVRTGAFASGAITAAAHTADRTRVFAGVGVARDWAQPGGVLTLEGSARVVQVVGGQSRVLPVSFGGTDMAVTAGSEGRTGLDLGLGLAWRAEGVEASLRYTGRFRDGARDHVLTAGVSVRW